MPTDTLANILGRLLYPDPNGALQQQQFYAQQRGNVGPMGYGGAAAPEQVFVPATPGAGVPTPVPESGSKKKNIPVPYSAGDARPVAAPPPDVSTLLGGQPPVDFSGSFRMPDVGPSGAMPMPNTATGDQAQAYRLPYQSSVDQQVAAALSGQQAPTGYFKEAFRIPDRGPSETMTMPNTTTGDQAQAYRLPYARSNYSSPNVIDQDSATMTRTLTSPTYGFGSADPFTQEKPNETVAATQAAIAQAPGETWDQKIANLPSNPIFQIGLALMGSDRRTPIGDSINSGLTQAQGFKNQYKADAANKAMQGFDPSRYTNSREAYMALVKNGVPGGSAASMANALFPPSERTSVSPGHTVIDENGKPVYTNTNAPPGGPTEKIKQLTAARDAARASGDTEAEKYYQAGLEKESGLETQQQHGIQNEANAEQRAANQAQRDANNEYRKQGQDAAQDARRQRNQQQLSEAMTKAGIPQMESTLSRVEEIMKKYAPGKLPGYGEIQGRIPDFLVGKEGQELRQAVQSLVNITLKDRSGAAVTDQEFERFKGELGSGAFMPEERIRQGIAHFRKLTEDIKRGIAAGYPDEAASGYQGAGGTPLPPRAGSGGGFSQSDVQAELKRRGMRK